MKASLFILFLLLCPAMLFAQMPGGGAGKGRMNSGRVYGKIVDSKTGKGVDAASVVILQTKDGKDVLVKGGLTEANGEFSMDELPLMGPLKLAVTNVGYKAYIQPVAFNTAALMKAAQNAKAGGGDNGGMPANSADLLNLTNLDLGNIKIEATAQNLKGVTVTAQVPQMSLQGEKRVFNVDKNITSQGGTAQDVLKNVPGVLVDADGNVTIRNSAPQILVDGRQTTLTLDQIPADAIESIEVVTNPSAKYDAEGGSGGVLNVVLKKNRKKGYNGNIRTGIDSRGGGNVGGDFNFRTGKFNVSASGFGNLNRNHTDGFTDRTDYYGAPDIFTHQDLLDKTKGGFGFAKLGIDYFISNRTTLSASFNKNHGEFHPNQSIDLTTDSLFNTISNNWSHRQSIGNNRFDRTGVQAGIKHLFSKPGAEWTADFNYSGSKNKNDNRYTTDYYGDAAHSDMLSESAQRTAGNGTNEFFTGQTDFVLPFSNGSKLEGGVKAAIRHVSSTSSNYFFDYTLNDYVVIPSPYTDYKNTDQVYAAYASYSGNLGANTSYQLGLRAESSNYDGTLTDTTLKFHNNYPVALFPSVFISRKLKHDQQLQFSYRRGVNRPNFFQLLPFTDYSDPLNIKQGNPGLTPEFTNSVEATYIKNFTRSNYLMVTAYYRHSSNLITPYQELGTNPFTNEAAIITTYINANSASKYGAEVTAQWDVTKWYNVLGNVNLYNAQLDAIDSTTKSTSYFSGFAKLNNNFKFAKKWSLQVSGVYQSKTSLLPESKNDGPGGRGPFGPPQSSAQGYLKANWSVDAALRYTFLKNDAASLSLSVGDIFGTRKFVQHSESDYFVQDYSRLTNPHLFKLNFAYKFGKVDTELFRRKNLKAQEGGGADSMY